ncbi:MAG TPA: hypothetical protein PKW41_12755, partial [Clostridia bacterium]|nr:hypothetical protein [Clostridia bacterium]
MASPLSPQQIAILKASPYVASVTARQISFTAQFKQRFYEEYTAGRKPCDILTRMGIDPGALGGPRIAGIRVHALEQGRSGYGLPDRRAQWQPGASHGRAKTSAEKIARLEH